MSISKSGHVQVAVDAGVMAITLAASDREERPLQRHVRRAGGRPGAGRARSGRCGWWCSRPRATASALAATCRTSPPQRRLGRLFTGERHDAVPEQPGARRRGRWSLAVQRPGRGRGPDHAAATATWCSPARTPSLAVPFVNLALVPEAASTCCCRPASATPAPTPCSPWARRSAARDGRCLGHFANACVPLDDLRARARAAADPQLAKPSAGRPDRHQEPDARRRGASRP